MISHTIGTTKGTLKDPVHLLEKAEFHWNKLTLTLTSASTIEVQITIMDGNVFVT